MHPWPRMLGIIPQGTWQSLPMKTVPRWRKTGSLSRPAEYSFLFPSSGLAGIKHPVAEIESDLLLRGP